MLCVIKSNNCHNPGAIKFFSTYLCSERKRSQKTVLQSDFNNTVKLGYNDHGYNGYNVTKICKIILSQIVGLHKASRL